MPSTEQAAGWSNALPLNGEKIFCALLRDKPGVYVFYDTLNNGLFTPLYIGHSENLEQSLNEHLSGAGLDDNTRSKLRHCSFVYLLAERNKIQGIHKFLFDSQPKKWIHLDPGGVAIRINDLPPHWERDRN
jgi:hypothetical protein